MNKLVDFCIQKRWLIIVITLSVFTLLFTGLGQLKVETNYDVYFDGDNARLTTQRMMEGHYGELDNALIGVASKSGDIFNKKDLVVIEKLTEELWLLPHITRVDSLTNHQYVVGDSEGIIVQDLFSSDEFITQDELLARKKYALQDPLTKNIYISEKGNVGGVVASLIFPEDDVSGPIKISHQVEDLVEKYRKEYSHLDFYLTGSIMINQQFFLQSTKGTAVSLGLSLLLIVVLMSLTLQSLMSVLALLVLTVLSLGGGVGIAAFLGIPFTGSSSSLPLIVSSIVVANCVHIFSSTRKAFLKNGRINDAIKEAYLSNSKPIFLSLITTIIGFACLNMSDVPPFRFLGTTAAICVALGLILNFTLLPALISFYLPRKKELATTPGRLDVCIQWVVVKVLERPVMTCFWGVIFSIGAGVLALQNEISDSLVTYFDEGVEFRDNTDLYMSEHSYFYTINLPVPSQGPGGISKLSFMTMVDQLTEWLRSQPEVKAVMTYTDFIKNINRAMNNNDPDQYRLPDNDELAAQYLLLYEVSLPYGLDLYNQMTIDKSEVKLIIGMNDVSSRSLREFDSRLINRLGQDYENGEAPTPTSATLMFAYIWRDSIVGTIFSMSLAIALITFIIAFALKSVKLSIISIVPNILPALFAFAIWFVLSGKIDIGAALVMIVSFGIVIDDSIHILSRFKSAFYELHKSVRESILYAYQHVGSALVLTTFIISVGFSMLGISDFTMNSHLGIMTCILITLAIVLDFVLLPAILLIIFKKPDARKPELTTDGGISSVQ